MLTNSTIYLLLLRMMFPITTIKFKHRFTCVYPYFLCIATDMVWATQCGPNEGILSIVLLLRINRQVPLSLLAFSISH